MNSYGLLSIRSLTLGLLLSLAFTPHASAQEPAEILWSYDTGG